jgi:hypothetical protein
MNLKWEKIDEGIYQVQAKERIFRVSRSNDIWELLEVLERQNVGECYKYLSNSKSLTTAKSLIKKFVNDQIYFDDMCRPKSKNIKEENAV